MPYIIKRYANRKLYDTRTKRYLTLDEVAEIVRAGEEVRVEEVDTGEDLTGEVLVKIIAEGSRKGGSLMVPQNLLVDLIMRSGETVLDAVKSSVTAGQRTMEQVAGSDVGKAVRSSVTAGQRTVEQMSAEVGKLVGGAVRRGMGETKKQAETAGEEISKVIGERLPQFFHTLQLPTREEHESLKARVDALEKDLKILRSSRAKARSKRSTASKASSSSKAKTTKSTGAKKGTGAR